MQPALRVEHALGRRDLLSGCDSSPRHTEQEWLVAPVTRLDLDPLLNAEPMQRLLTRHDFSLRFR